MFSWFIESLDFELVQISQNTVKFGIRDYWVVYSSSELFESIYFFQPEIFLLITSIFGFLYVVPLYYGTTNSYKKLTVLNFFINFYIFLLCTVFFLYGFNSELFDYNFTILLFNEKIFLNSSLTLLKMFLTFFTTLAFYFIKISNKENRFINRIFPEYFLYSPEILFIAILNLFFLLVLLSITDLFFLLIIIQGLTITTYFLFLGSNSKVATGSVLQYYYFSSLVLISLIISSFFFYHATGTLNFFLILSNMDQNFLGVNVETFLNFQIYHYEIIFSIFLFYFALFFKLGLAPLHPWTVDVAGVTPKPFLFITMVINKFGLFILLIRISLNLFAEFYIILQPLFFLIGFISILFGVLHLHSTKKIKFFLAYIMLQSTGFLLMIFSLFAPGVQEELTFVLVSFIYQYFFISFLGWSIFFLTWILCDNFLDFFWEYQHSIKYISDLELMGLILKNHSQTLLFGFVVSILLLVGFPPFLSFFVKFYSLVYILSFYGPLFVFIILMLFTVLTYRSFEIFRHILLFYHTENIKLAENLLVENIKVEQQQTCNDSLHETVRFCNQFQKNLSKFFVFLIIYIHINLSDFIYFINEFTEIFFLTIV